MSPLEFAGVRDFLAVRAGITLEAGKEYLAETRLLPLVEKLGLHSVGELLGRARSDHEVQQKLVEAMTTNETSFFRDNTPFVALRAAVFPSLAGSREPVRVWSAACSTGQEACSVAMLLHDHFPELARSARILGTDVNATVVEKARSGRYSQLEVNRGLPAQALVHHFRRVGLNFEVAPNIAAMCEFRVHNLLDPPSFGRFDLVLLRNVLIYFSAGTRSRVLQHVHRSLRPGGWLLLGTSEAGAVPPELFVGETHGTVSLFRPTHGGAR